MELFTPENFHTTIQAAYVGGAALLIYIIFFNWRNKLKQEPSLHESVKFEERPGLVPQDIILMEMTCMSLKKMIMVILE